MIYPLVRELAATDAPVRMPVAMTCRVLGFSGQVYYAWLPEPVSQRDWEDADLTNAALDVHNSAFSRRSRFSRFLTGHTRPDFRIDTPASATTWSNVATHVVDAAPPNLSSPHSGACTGTRRGRRLITEADNPASRVPKPRRLPAPRHRHTGPRQRTRRAPRPGTSARRPATRAARSRCTGGASTRPAPPRTLFAQGQVSGPDPPSRFPRSGPVHGTIGTMPSFRVDIVVDMNLKNGKARAVYELFWLFGSVPML